ncbi:MAG TPA: phosphoadenylyl-sulfate reductase [Actinomycetota bacterium]|jgi:thioredoxin-dependent adenylylsulfate APS reductase|nr:phosphoadenylyl-sulfate reductase [Actinomycetota bacterium]
MSDQTALDEYEAGELAVLYDASPSQDVLAWALDRFHPQISISVGGGAEGMVIVDMAWRINPEVRVFTLDTGRLPQETYDLMQQVRDRYGIQVEMLFPERAHLEGMLDRHGPNLMYDSVDLRFLCCQVRKVLPLNRYLKDVEAWITGLRREQWASRAEVRKIELDHDHGGIVKVNPLADWTKEEVWEYIRANEVPYHALYDQGYTSIGCAPCTRPIQPGEPDRAGRWWWETDAPKECGIHCAIYTGGFEHELNALLGERADGQDGDGHRGSGQEAG